MASSLLSLSFSSSTHNRLLFQSSTHHHHRVQFPSRNGIGQEGPPPSRRVSSLVPRSSKDTVSPPDRVISAICYLYPFLDGVHYGKYLITQFPTFQVVLSPLVPVIRVFNSFPLNGFLVFLALYFAVVRNPQTFSRYVRFNTMQAVVLDVLLIFPDLIERSFNPTNGLGLDFMMSVDSTVFLFLLVCLVFGSGSCLFGQVPRLPLVADAADRQVVVDSVIYKNKAGRFGSSIANLAIETSKPIVWWQTYETSTSELRTHAMRILALCASTSSYSFEEKESIEFKKIGSYDVHNIQQKIV